MYMHKIIAQYLNGKQVKDLNSNMLQFVTYIFGHLNGNSLISCNILNDNLIKPNICLVINGMKSYVSMSDGIGISVHEEQPNSIDNFLISLSAPLDVRNFIHDLCFSSYHTTEFIARERTNNPTRLNTAKSFFDTNKHTIIERAMKTGTLSNCCTEYVYSGDVNAGVVRNINDTIRILNGIHSNRSLFPIGGLSLQRKDRFVNNSIQLKWSSPGDDLQIL